MSRTVSRGWGNAPVGGAYTVDEADYFSVNGSVARVSIAPGTDRQARLGVTARDIDARARFSLSSIPASGSGVYLALTSRRDSAGNEYKVRVRVKPGGEALLSVVRTRTGSTSGVGQETRLATRIAAGIDYWLRTSVTGSTTVTLAAKAWQSGAAEPGWQHSVSDSSSSRLSSAGGLGFWSYVSSSASSTTVSVDELRGTTVDANSAPEPAPDPEPAPAPAPSGPDPASDAGAKLPISYDLASISGTKYFVATSGSDSAAGSQSAPLRTVAAALAKVPNGGSATVVVRGGTYREGRLTIPSGRAVRIIAHPRETPMFVGSQVYSSGWVTEGSYRYHSYTPQPVTNASGISFSSGQGLTGSGAGKFPDQAWVGGKQLRQVTSKSAVTAGTFWVDSSNKRIYLASTDVSAGTVEVSDKDVFLTIQGARSALEGVVVSRFSNSADDYGVVKILGTGDGAVIRNVQISEAAFQALMLAGEESTSGILYDVLLENVSVLAPNWMGVSANMVENVTLNRVRIEKSNQFKEFTDAPQSGAYKGSRNRKVKLLNSLIKDNTGHGVWFDQSSYDLEVAGNKFLGNTATSLFVEISDKALIVNNYMRSSGGRTLKLAGASGIRLVNNTIVGAADPIGVYVDSRSKAGCADPAKPLCAGSYKTDRDYVRPRPATLDWMPRIDLMLNNVIAYPTSSGYCGVTTAMCITDANGTARAPIETVIHKADSSRGIPQTRIDGNVYANGSGTVVSTTRGKHSSHSAFGSAMGATPVSIAGVEKAGKTGNKWVNADGQPTSSLKSVFGEAVAAPTDAAINKYIPAGTRAYGYLW